MKMRVLLATLPLLASLGGAQEGPPCRTPQQLEYSFWELDPNKREFHDRPVTFRAEGYQIYDGDRQRRFTREDRVNFNGTTPDEEKFEYFEDFRERYVYARSQSDRQCKVYQMDPRRTWADHWVGVPPNATFEGVTTVGAYPINIEEFHFRSNSTYHNHCLGVEHVHLTARECAPIVRHFYCEDTGFEIKDYMNLVIGIADPEGHINPHSPDWSDCKRSEALPWDHNEARRAERKAALESGIKAEKPAKAPERRRLQHHHDGPDCEAPKQLEYSFWEADPDRREFHGHRSDFMARGFEIYDAENFRRYRREDLLLDPEGNDSQEDKFEILEDYYRRAIWARKIGDPAGCKIYEMDGDRRFPLIGANYDEGDQFRGESNLGAYPIELTQWAFSNNKTDHMKCEGFTYETYTEKECIPISRHFYCDDKGFELRDYYNTVIGISDPDGHINPFSEVWQDCTKA